MITDSAYEPMIKFWVKAGPTTGSSIFSFSEYLAALALLMVVMTISDFRYRLRLALAGNKLRQTAFIFSAFIGFAILLTDFWFHNGLPVPFFLNSATNIKVLLGLLFLLMILSLIYAVFLDPPKYNKKSAMRFAEISYQLIGEGDPSRIQTLLVELGPNLSTVFKLAARPQRQPQEEEHNEPVDDATAASNDLILLLADPRLCDVVAKSSPWFALDALRAFKSIDDNRQVPFSGFMRNVSRAFFKNKESAIHLEESGYDSGLMGYVKQISTEMFGDFRTVERCAEDGQSPFDLDFKELTSYDGDQAETLCRCAALFFESYLEETKGTIHSYAFARLVSELDHLVQDLHKLNDPAYRDWPNVERDRLRAVVDFIRKAIEQLELQKVQESRSQKLGQRSDTFQYIAELIFELILKSTEVDTSDFVAWEIQHNALWSRLFRNGNEEAERIVRKRVFRLMYNEIKKMDEFPNFKGARVIAYCLNVLGLNPGDRHKGHRKEDYPLRMLASHWTKANYRNLLENHPKVGKSCLTFRVEYDAQNHRLVKTFSNETRKEPPKAYLDLD